MTEAEDLRAVIREAHETIKDLRAVTRDALDVLAQVKIAASKAVTEEIGDAIQNGLVQYHLANQDAIEQATKDIYTRFSAIGDILMGEDRDRKRAGSAIQELAQRWASEGT